MAWLTHFGREPTNRSMAVSLIRYGCLAEILWGGLYPRPYPLLLAVLVANPFIALVIALVADDIETAAGVPSVVGNNSRSSTDLTVIVGLSGGLLPIRSVLEIPLVDYALVLLPAIVVGLILAGGFALLLPMPPAPFRAAGTAALWACLAFYSGGVLVYANSMLDRSHPTRWRVEILDKYDTPTDFPLGFHFVLGQWGPHSASNDVSVGPELFEKARIGDTICVWLYDGAFSFPWYLVGGCSNDERPSRPIDRVSQWLEIRRLS